jgi:hypothetical protein
VIALEKHQHIWNEDFTFHKSYLTDYEIEQDRHEVQLRKQLVQNKYYQEDIEQVRRFLNGTTLRRYYVA